MKVIDVVTEIRFKPNALFLDSRGRFAQSLCVDMQFDDWEMTDSEIHFRCNDKNRSGAFAYNRIYFQVRNPASKNYFQDQSSKFINACFKMCNSLDDSKILRIGSRFRKLQQINESFAEAVKKSGNFYNNSIQNLEDKPQIVDFGTTVNYKDYLGNFNIISGPMEKSQSLKTFQNLEECDTPDVAIFFDIDYFVDTNIIMKANQITNKINSFVQKANLRCDEYLKIYGVI